MTRKINYEDFVEKFKTKNTDDCYTPENIYEAVLNWCVAEYGIDKKMHNDVICWKLSESEKAIINKLS